MGTVDDVMAELEDLGALGQPEEPPELVEALDVKPVPRAAKAEPVESPEPTQDLTAITAKLDQGISILENLLIEYRAMRQVLAPNAVTPQLPASVPQVPVAEAPPRPAAEVGPNGVPTVSEEQREQALASALAKIRGEDPGQGRGVAEDAEDDVPYVGQERIKPADPSEFTKAYGR